MRIRGTSARAGRLPVGVVALRSRRGSARRCWPVPVPRAPRSSRRARYRAVDPGARYTEPNIDVGRRDEPLAQRRRRRSQDVGHALGDRVDAAGIEANRFVLLGVGRMLSVRVGLHVYPLSPLRARELQRDFAAAGARARCPRPLRPRVQRHLPRARMCRPQRPRATWTAGALHSRRLPSPRHVALGRTALRPVPCQRSRGHIPDRGIPSR
jgi:hypothetical protein